ncbi:MAG: cyclic nucleotide-binding domain-containing protein [Bdellovibrio sp.]
MRFEREKIQLRDFQLQPSTEGGSLTVSETRKSYRVNRLHYSYLEVLKNPTSIEELVQFFLGQGWLVSFRELHSLLSFLASENILLNASLKKYIQSADHSEGPGSAGSPVSLSVADLPFFRSLDRSLAEYLMQRSERLQLPAQTTVLRAGERSRDLYILLQGQAALYRPLPSPHQRQWISQLEAGALFGERGFLLGEPRSADVITKTPCELLRVRYLPEFDALIKTEKARSLQHRFWVLQALSSSPFFKDLPGESLDSLIFSGRLCQAPAHHPLFQEGQAGNTCYIVVQGNVLIQQKGKNINVLKQGSCFGEISLLMSGGVRTASAITQQECLFLEIHQKDFYRVLTQNILLAKEIETLAAQRLNQDQTRRAS